ncbi:substrate-binding periplasmic protein [Pseudoduganella sp. OTU4001]|uniref:substrate-binding periplasmic protein n=1 Tax=Pseudoduganella sp. OTU4001 TaxID=3043854 RepID=UPI00313D26FF
MTAFGLTAKGGWASEPTQVRVAAQTDSEPKFIAQVGGVVGNCIDIFRAIEKIDPDIKFVGEQRWMPLKRIEAMVGARQLDAICGLIRNEDRLAAYKIPETPLFTVTYHFLVRADDPINVKTLDEVRRLKDDGVILVNGGSGPVATLKNAGHLKIDSAASSSSTNIEKLLAGRGRFFYYRQPGLNSEIRKSGHASKVRILPATFDSQVFYMMLGAHVGKDAESKISQALIKLSESGELKQIADKWATY